MGAAMETLGGQWQLSTEFEDLVAPLDFRYPKLTMDACGIEILKITQDIKNAHYSVKKEATSRAETQSPHRTTQLHCTET